MYKLRVHKTSLTAENANIQCSKVAMSISGVNFDLFPQMMVSLGVLRMFNKKLIFKGRLLEETAEAMN